MLNFHWLWPRLLVLIWFLTEAFGQEYCNGIIRWPPKCPTPYSQSLVTYNFHVTNPQQLLCSPSISLRYLLYQIVVQLWSFKLTIKRFICGKCSILSSLLWTSFSQKGSPNCKNWKYQKFLPLVHCWALWWLPELWAHRNQRAQLKVFKELSSLVEKPSNSTLLITVSKLLIVTKQVLCTGNNHFPSPFGGY